MEAITTLKVGGMSLGGAGVIGATGYGAYTLMQPSNIREQLLWERKDVLPTDPDKPNDRKDDWTELVTDYEGISNATDKIDNMTLTKPSGDDRAENIKKLKEKCETLLKTRLGAEDYESKYGKAEKWCVKKPKTNQA